MSFPPPPLQPHHADLLPLHALCMDALEQCGYVSMSDVASTVWYVPCCSCAEKLVELIRHVFKGDTYLGT